MINDHVNDFMTIAASFKGCTSLALCLGGVLRLMASEVLAEGASDSDAQFMELIRQIPPIYDKSAKEFHDKRKKGNCWKKMASLLNTSTEEVERRYKSIRTAFTRYLAKQQGKSGSGSAEVGPLDPKFEHLRWLLIYIRSRPSFSNLEKRSSALAVSSPPFGGDEDNDNEGLEHDDEDMNTGHDEVNILESEPPCPASRKSPEVTGSSEQCPDISFETEKDLQAKKRKKGDASADWNGAKLHTKEGLKKNR